MSEQDQSNIVERRQGGSGSAQTQGELNQSLGLFSALTVVAGSMVGSGIFIVSAETVHYVGTGGMLMAVWIFSAVLTLLGAASYAKFAGHLPRAGGQYVFLKEAWGEIPAFLYGWVLFTVIQTGFLAAVAVAFARYVGVLTPEINTRYFVQLSPQFGISSEQMLAVVVLIVLTWFNTTGIKNGAALQNVFTTLKVIALLAVILIGLSFGVHLFTPGAIDWSLHIPQQTLLANDLGHESMMAIFATAAVGPLFSADAWNYVTFIGGEVRDAKVNLPKALIMGTVLVLVLYLLVNLAYLNVLTLDEIQTAPEQRVAAALMSRVFGPHGASLMAMVILVSAFGCLNGMLFSGARVFYAMAKDRLLFRRFAEVDPLTKSPNFALWVQCAWSVILALSGRYSDLLAYVVFTSLLFYIITMAGLIKLGLQHPEEYQMTRKRDFALPVAYIAGAGFIALYLLIGGDKWFTSLAGVLFTLLGLIVYFGWKKLVPAQYQETWTDRRNAS
ncbi:MAG: amino acid permease [Cyanobacteria bacterium]|nr:amino acid permease [Cyanobacteriota bacterium]